MDNFSCNTSNYVSVPMYQHDSKGAIIANTLFHRSNDKLHSRCIEYPFAAAQLGEARCILDVGSAKADPAWISWLEHLPIEVHATDYDQPSEEFRRIKFCRADVRNLPIPDQTYDLVFAVSVIEHIGLASPQVFAREIPHISENGDLEAVQELARVLKQSGKLVMTLPFGLDDVILWGDARNYTQNSIRKFDQVLSLQFMEYYEYQHTGQAQKYEEFPSQRARQGIWRRIFNRARASLSLASRTQDASKLRTIAEPAFVNSMQSTFGSVVWRRLSPSETTAIHAGHIEGVICGVWRKQ
jgi:SAM-dependent methyltransferase